MKRRNAWVAAVAAFAVGAGGVPLAAQAARTLSGTEESQMGFGANRLSEADRNDILALYARYSQDLDNGDAEDLATQVFAPDGRFHDPSVCAVGSDQIRQLASTFGRPLQDRSEQHLPYNMVVWGSGKRASGHAYVSVLGQRLGHGLNGARPHIDVMGTYTDTFTKTGAGWRIQDREVWRPGTVKKFADCPTPISSLR